ncbi:MAG: hypothetical protein M0Z99_34800 [Betaproteobacteria bacterium]|nr:hypothetical protein [Betaproteobacteria bacterium]
MTTATTTDTLHEIFGEPIHTYTRAQSIEDGFLVNLSDPESDTAEVCRQHYKYPIACTRAVFELMRRAVENPKHANDWRGVLHDMLWMSRVFKRSIDASTVQFKVIITGTGHRRNHEFKLRVGPGDQGEPVITIMMPDED